MPISIQSQLDLGAVASSRDRSNTVREVLSGGRAVSVSRVQSDGQVADLSLTKLCIGQLVPVKSLLRTDIRDDRRFSDRANKTHELRECRDSDVAWKR